MDIYLLINFEPFSEECLAPKITKIRFGWLNHSDWKPQAAETGQQASVKVESKKKKLLELYNRKRPPINLLNIDKIIESLNEDKMSELEVEFGRKANTIKNNIKKMGYTYSKELSKYIKN